MRPLLSQSTFILSDNVVSLGSFSSFAINSRFVKSLKPELSIAHDNNKCALVDQPHQITHLSTTNTNSLQTNSSICNANIRIHLQQHIKSNDGSSGNNINKMSSSGSITNILSQKSNRSSNNNDDDNNKECINTNQIRRGMHFLSTSNRVISHLSPSSNNTIPHQQQHPRLTANPHLRIISSTKSRTTFESPRRRGIQIRIPLLPQHLLSQSTTSNSFVRCRLRFIIIPPCPSFIT